MTPSSFGRWTAASAILILATGTVLAGSPPITATWKGQADDPNGNSYPIQVALSQKGTQLTGGVTTPAGSFPLTGTISGTTFSFRTGSTAPQLPSTARSATAARPR